MRLHDPVRGTDVVPDLAVCETAWESTVGLLGRDGLDDGEGLLIPGVRSIHMIGMRFAIDAVWLDGEMVVRKIVRTLKPWRLSACFGAGAVVELPAGAAARAGIETGRGYVIMETRQPPVADADEGHCDEC